MIETIYYTGRVSLVISVSCVIECRLPPRTQESRYPNRQPMNTNADPSTAGVQYSSQAAATRGAERSRCLETRPVRRPRTRLSRPPVWETDQIQPHETRAERPVFQISANQMTGMSVRGQDGGSGGGLEQSVELLLSVAVTVIITTAVGVRLPGQTIAVGTLTVGLCLLYRLVAALETAAVGS